MFTPKVGFFYRYCFFNVFSSENWCRGEPKMKLIFSNSSGFALVQKKHLGTDRLIHFQEIHSNETLTDSSPHEVFVWCGIGWGWKYENQICWKLFTSDSFKCHYKQLFGSMFDGWFSCWAIFGGGFTYVFCSCSYPCFEECSSYPIGFGIFTFTININHPSRWIYRSHWWGEKRMTSLIEIWSFFFGEVSSDQKTLVEILPRHIARLFRKPWNKDPGTFTNQEFIVHVKCQGSCHAFQTLVWGGLCITFCWVTLLESRGAGRKPSHQLEQLENPWTTNLSDFSLSWKTGH